MLVYNAYCTCTVEPIPFKAFITRAVKTAISVSTICIGTAWICLQFTLIDICRLNECMMIKHACTLHVETKITTQVHYIQFSHLQKMLLAYLCS